MENISFLIPEIPQKQNLKLPCASNYSQRIHIVLGIISNLEMIQVYGRICISYMQILIHFT